MHRSPMLLNLSSSSGSILCVNNSSHHTRYLFAETNENTLRTDSQDYCADEILSHPFILTPPMQRAACALHFEGSVPTRINRNHSINQMSTHSF